MIDKRTSQRNAVSHLLIRISNGDQAAFSELLKQYDEYIYSRAFMLTKSVDSARELTQDVFIRLWEKRAQLQYVQNFEGYLFIILKNRFITELRKNVEHLSQHFINETTEQSAQPDELLVSKNMNDVLQKAIDLLPPVRRNVFRLSRFEGYSYDEIAQQLNISRNTVKDHISLSIKFLKKYMSQYISLIIIILTVWQKKV